MVAIYFAIFVNKRFFMSHSTNTIAIYLESKKSILEKIRAVDALIDTMTLRMADVAGGLAAVTDEYWMDDGQMKIKTSYRSIDQVEAGINALEKMKQRWVNKYNGRIMTLRDARKL